MYFSGQLEYAKFKQSAQTLFIESIVEAADFEFHNTEYEPGKSVGNLSREIMKKIDTRDANVKDYIDFPLICTPTCAYQEVRNVNFLENFVYVLNEQPITASS